MTDEAFYDEAVAAFDITPWVDKAVANANAAMESAAKETVIQWLRLHGFIVIEPDEREI